MENLPHVKSEYLRRNKKGKFEIIPGKEKAAAAELNKWRTDYREIAKRKKYAPNTKAKMARDLEALNILAHRPYARIVRPTRKNRAKWKKYAQQSGPYKMFIVEAKSPTSKIRLRKGAIVEKSVAGSYRKFDFDIDALIQEFDETGEVIQEVSRLWKRASKNKKPTGAKILIGNSSVAGGNLFTSPEVCADKIATMLNSGNSGQAVAEYLTGLEFLYGNLKLHNSLAVVRRKKNPRKVKKNGRNK